MDNSIFAEDLRDEYDEYGNIVKKVCSCCGELKPISEFYKNGRAVNGKPKYRRDCKKCYRANNDGRTKEYREKKWLEKYGVPKLEVREVD